MDPTLAAPYALLAIIPALVAISMLAVLARSRRTAFGLSTALLAVEATLASYLLYSGADVMAFGTFHLYGASLLFAALFPVLLLLVNVLAYGHSESYAENLLMLCLVLAGAQTVSFAGTLLALLVGLELIMVPACFMMLLDGKHRAEAAVKFFVLGAVSAGVFSFAVALVFPYNPQLSIAALGANAGISGSYLPLLSLLLFVAALGFESALFPFNLWVPDVYEGAPSYVTAMLSGVDKNVAFVALIEVLFVVFAAYKQEFSSLALLLSVATMLFGNLVALAQRSVKRMLAYSSISQAGYILIGIAAATQFGVEASIFQMIAHAFMTIGAFSVVMWLEAINLKTLDDYSGLHSRNGFAAVSLTVLMLSMAGIPPLMGFYGKFLLFSSAISANLLVLALLGVLNSFVSIFYYARVISAMYSAVERWPVSISPYVAAVVVAALAVVVAFGLYPQPVIALAQMASQAIVGA